MTDITLDTSQGYGRSLGYGASTTFHLPGMVAGSLVIRLFFFNQGLSYTIEENDPSGNSTWSSYQGNSWYTAWTTVGDGEATITVTSEGGGSFALGWGNSSMDTDETHWGHLLPVTYDLGGMSTGGTLDLDGNPTNPNPSWAPFSENYGNGFQYGSAPVNPPPLPPPAEYPLHDLNASSIGSGWSDSFDISWPKQGMWASIGGDTGYRCSGVGYGPDLLGYGGWTWDNSVWVGVIGLSMQTEKDVVDTYNWRLPDTRGQYGWDYGTTYPTWQLGSMQLRTTPLTIHWRGGADENITNNYTANGAYEYLEQGQLEVWNLDPAGHPDVMQGGIAAAERVEPRSFGNQPGDVLVSIMTGWFNYDMASLVHPVNVPSPGVNPTTGYWDPNRIVTRMQGLLGVTMNVIRETYGFQTAYGDYLQAYWADYVYWHQWVDLPGVDTYYGVAPGMGMLKIKTDDGTWRNIGGATWDTQYYNPAFQQMKLRVGSGWAKEEDTWYPQTSDSRPVYIKTADGWALGCYMGNNEAATSPLGDGSAGTGPADNGSVDAGSDTAATGAQGDIYNPWSGYSITGTWQDHMSYSAGGIDYPLGYGTNIAAPAAGTLHTSGGSGEFTAGWVGSAGRRSVLYLDQPMARQNPNLEQNEGSGPMVAIVFQHQSVFGSARHYSKGEYCGKSGASANGADYGGDIHLHVHGLTAGGQRVDFLNFI